MSGVRTAHGFKEADPRVQEIITLIFDKFIELDPCDELSATCGPTPFRSRDAGGEPTVVGRRDLYEHHRLRKEPGVCRPIHHRQDAARTPRGRIAKAGSPATAIR